MSRAGPPDRSQPTRKDPHLRRHRQPRRHDGKAAEGSHDEEWGPIKNHVIRKITGKSDKPSELIRLYKNEREPSIAVTVDLLTTGIDVPEIVNIVFLR